MANVRDFLKKTLLAPTENTYLQFFRYIFVGGFAFVIDFALLYVFTEYFGWYYLFSAAVSFVCGLVVNFLLSKKFIFTTGGPQNRVWEFVFFGGIGLVGLFINEVVLWYVTAFVGWYYMYSKILATMVVYVWNFFARKYLLYGHKGDKKS